MVEPGRARTHSRWCVDRAPGAPDAALRDGACAFAFAAALSATRLLVEPLREVAFGQGAAGQALLDGFVLAGAVVGLACLVYRDACAGFLAPARQASSPRPGMPASCTSRPSSGSSKSGNRWNRRQRRQASAAERTRTG